MGLFSVMISMVTPKNDNSIITLLKLFQRIDQTTNIHIHVTNRRPITLQGVRPPVLLHQFQMVAPGIAEFLDTKLGNISQILPYRCFPILHIIGGRIRRQDSRSAGIVLGRDGPGQMRFLNPTRQKQWLGSASRRRIGIAPAIFRTIQHPIDAVAHGMPILIVLISEFVRILARSIKSLPLVGLLVVAVPLGGILVPILNVYPLRFVKSVTALVIGLTSTSHVISVPFEVSVNPHPTSNVRRPGMVLIVVAAGRGGPDAGPDGRAGGVAYRRGGVSVGEG
mmetsp:Transcript_30535/g.67105  ORF Transcript_30535/g.67105 Transcript_30535/m.67105 type:complete len:280 (+) Transcript_30535:1447-2286(+)